MMNSKSVLANRPEELAICRDVYDGQGAAAFMSLISRQVQRVRLIYLPKNVLQWLPPHRAFDIADLRPHRRTQPSV